MTRRTAYVVAGLTVLAVAGVLGGYRPTAIAGGLLLAFGLPGAALSAVLFRDRARLARIEQVVLVPALSLATVVLGGLVAWAVGASLHRTTWLVLSAGVTFAGLVTAIIRPGVAPAPVAAPARVRVKLPTAADVTLILPVFLDREGIREPESMGLGRRLVRQAPPLALAVALLAGATWLSLGSSIATHKVTVTALSAAPPAAPDAAGRRAVAVSASGLTAGAGVYTLVVSSPSGAQHGRYPVTANARGGWTATLALPGTERLTLGLYRAGQQAALRTVIIAAASAG